MRRRELKEVNGEVGKSCSKCNLWKPLSLFDKCSKGVGGTKSRCKECRKVDGKNRNKTDRLLKSSKLEHRGGVIGKTCTNCGSWKPLINYYKSKKGLGGRNSICPECVKVLRTPYMEANREIRRERTRIWARENRERKTEYKRKWRLKNPGYESKWWSEHRELANVIAQRRRSRVRALPSDLTYDEYLEVLSYFNNSCSLTGESGDLHMDHVIPISTGHGGTTKGNIIPLKSELNLSKNDKNIFEWFEVNKSRLNLSQEKFDSLINWLASANGMSMAEYKEYVYYCHDNLIDSEKEAN